MGAFAVADYGWSAEEIERLGRVKYVVAPNNMHYLYFEECLKMFPEARGYVAESLVKKHKRFDKYLRVEALKKAVGAEIEQVEFKGHTLGETVFFHKASATMIVTDLLYNLQANHLRFEKFVMRIWGAYGKPSVPLYHKVAIKDVKQVAKSVEKVEAWPVERIIMAHGTIITGSRAGRAFRSAWSRFIT